MPRLGRTYFYFVGMSLLIFAIHSSVRSALTMDLWSAIMLQSYGINVGLGLGLIALAHYLLAGQSSYVGWAFIGVSGLKFILFFAFIAPEIKQDGVTTSAEFTSFFVPYLCCLLMELRILAKRLNAL